MLERRGFRVVEASDGIDGLAKYERERDGLTVAFIDLTMPRMAGDELIRAIRRDNPVLPLILMSGFSELELAEQVREDQIAAFVQKPFRVAELDRSLRRILAPRMTN
jgi:CheY-like chemotaxis protein